MLTDEIRKNQDGLPESHLEFGTKPLKPEIYLRDYGIVNNANLNIKLHLLGGSHNGNKKKKNTSSKSTPVKQTNPQQKIKILMISRRQQKRQYLLLLILQQQPQYPKMWSLQIQQNNCWILFNL